MNLNLIFLITVYIAIFNIGWWVVGNDIKGSGLVFSAVVWVVAFMYVIIFRSE